MEAYLNSSEHYTEVDLVFQKDKYADYYLELEADRGFVTDQIPDCLYVATGCAIYDKLNYVGQRFNLEALGEYFLDMTIQQNTIWFYFDDRLLKLCGFKDINEMQEHINSNLAKFKESTLSFNLIKSIKVGYVGE